MPDTSAAYFFGLLAFSVFQMEMLHQSCVQQLPDTEKVIEKAEHTIMFLQNLVQ
jgi:hypothetical protein